MSWINEDKSNQQTADFMYYSYIDKILTLRNLKQIKAIENVKKFPQQYLLSAVQKLLIFIQYGILNKIFFISDRPYLKTNGKLVFIFSDNNSYGKLLFKQDPAQLGPNIISILKTIYNDLYDQNQSPSEDFKQIVQYVMEHEEKFNENLYSSQEIKEILESFPFIIKNNLQIRIKKALLLRNFYPKLEQKKYYRQLIVDSLTSYNFSTNLKNQTCSTLRYLQKFLFLCTKDSILIFPAKRTLDSKSKIDSFQSEQHFVINLITRQVKKSIFYEKFQRLDQLNNKRFSYLTQIMFSFTKISQKNEEYLLVKLQSDFYMSGISFLYFGSIFQQVLEKYTDVYLKVGFESSFEENLNCIKVSVRKKESKLDFNYKLRINRRQSIIIDFIRAIDLMLIIYLLFQDLLIKYQDDQYLQTLTINQDRLIKSHLIEQISLKMFREVRKYLQNLTIFKRNIFYPLYT